MQCWGRATSSWELEVESRGGIVAALIGNDGSYKLSSIVVRIVRVARRVTGMG
jgi:hypothetical protein